MTELVTSDELERLASTEELKLVATEEAELTASELTTEETDAALDTLDDDFLPPPELPPQPTNVSTARMEHTFVNESDFAIAINFIITSIVIFQDL